MEISITEKNDRLVALLCGELDNIACIKAKKDLAPCQPWGQAPGACGINSNLPEKFGSMNKKAYLCA